jgi:parallel beta-helix repeat protein
LYDYLKEEQYTSAFNLTGLLVSDNHTIRIYYDAPVYIDWIGVDNSKQREIVVHETIKADYANASYRGAANRIKASETHSGWLNYDSIREPTNLFTGNATRYGDVLYLLNRTDDIFYISTEGDDIAMEFDVSELPEVQEGYNRTYFIESYAWFLPENNVMGENYTSSFNFTLLPFRNMSIYPYDDSVEKYPDDEEHNFYLEEYNTRYVTGEGDNTAYGIYIDSSLYGNIYNITGTGGEAGNGEHTYNGIYLKTSNYTNISLVNLDDWRVGITLYSSSNNNLTDITANSNSDNGIYLSSSSNNNQLTNITANSNSNNGIYLSSSSNNNQLTNITTNSNFLRGIYLYSSSNNNLRNCNMTNNTYNFNIFGSENSHFDNDIDTSNIVEGGFRIYYNYSIQNYTYDLSSASDAGIVICADCRNITVKDLNLSHKNLEGVYFFNTTYSKIESITANSNQNGIRIESSSNNNLTDITTNSNSDHGIYLSFSSNNNQLKNITTNSNSMNRI